MKAHTAITLLHALAALLVIAAVLIELTIRQPHEPEAAGVHDRGAECVVAYKLSGERPTTRARRSSPDSRCPEAVGRASS